MNAKVLVLGAIEGIDADADMYLAKSLDYIGAELVESAITFAYADTAKTKSLANISQDDIKGVLSKTLVPTTLSEHALNQLANHVLNHVQNDLDVKHVQTGVNKDRALKKLVKGYTKTNETHDFTIGLKTMVLDDMTIKKNALVRLNKMVNHVLNRIRHVLGEGKSLNDVKQAIDKVLNDEELCNACKLNATTYKN